MQDPVRVRLSEETGNPVAAGNGRQIGKSLILEEPEKCLRSENIKVIIYIIFLRQILAA